MELGLPMPPVSTIRHIIYNYSSRRNYSSAVIDASMRIGAWEVLNHAHADPQPDSDFDSGTDFSEQSGYWDMPGFQDLVDVCGC